MVDQVPMQLAESGLQFQPVVEYAPQGSSAVVHTVVIFEPGSVEISAEQLSSLFIMLEGLVTACTAPGLMICVGAPTVVRSMIHVIANADAARANRTWFVSAPAEAADLVATAADSSWVRILTTGSSLPGNLLGREHFIDL